MFQVQLALCFVGLMFETALGECVATLEKPSKLPCPAGMRDDGTSCWKDPYGRGVGRIPDKSPCPSGLRDDGTSSWTTHISMGKGVAARYGDAVENADQVTTTMAVLAEKLALV
ncbi:uncharacterized protein LOC128549163 [Mercenaria mercenaria]|uniref:uncharacterized protein LOC128549163 n=1 Tax=Mercenaria mercenaria TaxID=6596 RepID=UPI00234ECD2A|nr:uncharacterized protein LOC128549163 [Mercenaria mercenaria]